MEITHTHEVEKTDATQTILSNMTSLYPASI